MPPSVPESRCRWYFVTPGRLIALLLAAEGGLFVANWFRWSPKGYAVLLTIAAVGAYLLVLLLWWIAAMVFHRRFQFSLRTLFVLTIAVALPCSWLAVEMKRAREQKALVELASDCFYNNNNQVQASVRKALYLLLGRDFFLQVIDLGFRSSQIADAELEHLDGLDQLHRRLSLPDHGIHGVGRPLDQQRIMNRRTDHDPTLRRQAARQPQHLRAVALHGKPGVPSLQSFLKGFTADSPIWPSYPVFEKV
jgi:hypothetical protein